MATSIIASKSISSDGSTPLELALDGTAASVHIRWDWISTVNEDSRGTRNDIYVRRGSMRRYLKMERQSDQHYSVDVSPGIELPGDHLICCEFLGSSSGDILRLTAFGVVVEPVQAIP